MNPVVTRNRIVPVRQSALVKKILQAVILIPVTPRVADEQVIGTHSRSAPLASTLADPNNLGPRSRRSIRSMLSFADLRRCCVSETPPPLKNCRRLVARAGARACDTSATVLKSHPSTARRPLLCAVLQPPHPYAGSTCRKSFARIGPHLGHARLLALPKRTATDTPSVASAGPWRYRCGYSEYANTPVAHHSTAALSRLSAVCASLTPQLAVEGVSRGDPCQATISSEGREPIRIPGFAGPAAGSRVDVAVTRVSAAGPNLRGRG